MAASATTLTGKFNPELNVPQTIALRFTKGREMESQFGGIEYLFSLDDGRPWYVKPQVAAQIESLGISAYRPFLVTKRSATRYEFQILGDVSAAGTAPTSGVNPGGSNRNQHVDHNAAARHAALARTLDAGADEPDWLNEGGALTNASALLNQAIRDTFAAVQGFPITFSEESVRAMSISLFIEANRKAAR
jgi:hypothetical protein